MMKIKILATITFLTLIFPKTFADEGMWIPMLINKNIEDMQAKGLKLNAEDLYSVNNASLKDAIVIFGGGCTGELVSDKGLLITNHHCGYSSIQEHSSLEHDYLKDGFWAMNESEELPNPGLSVTFLVRMDDVTDTVLAGVSQNISEAEREAIIHSNISRICSNATAGTHYKAIVKPFFDGNQYFLFVNEVYTDVRLVGAPPESIGKFGGDTDNWMWPRHTGDFSMFRIYAGKDNLPAEYSPENVPYKPKKYLPVSVKGVNPDDFTMVYGYPGSTQEYISSFAVNQIMNIENPNQILLRRQILDIYKDEMAKSREIRIQYSSKDARVANYWKKWIGENRGLKRLDAIERKKQFEKEFTAWANDNGRTEYTNLMNEFKDAYELNREPTMVLSYMYEAAYAIEFVRLARAFSRIIEKAYPFSSQEDIEKIKAPLKDAADNFFKDYYQTIDLRVFSAVLNTYRDSINAEYQPEFFNLVKGKYKNDFSLFAKFVFEKSFLTDKGRAQEFINNLSVKAIKNLDKDPGWNCFDDFLTIHRNMYFSSLKSTEAIDSLQRIFVKGIMEMKSSERIYPDANSTLRITYGKVKDYYPRDAVHYEYYTTLAGIVEKDNPEIYDYRVPEKLKQLYQDKDYGIYGENGKMKVCFTGTNHTTGGNSGSPVINGEGELIGVNFDRNWEGTMSDIMYDPDMCRNITLDIRYLLFIVDKFAGASHLVQEMEIRN